MSTRDSQRQRVFAAEEEVAAACRQDGHDMGLGFGDQPIFVNDIIRTRWAGSRFPLGRPATVHFYSARYCNAETKNGGHLLYIPSERASAKLTIIHAIAHVFTPPITGPPDQVRPWHSPAFCLTYLKMVKRFAPEAEEHLRAAFKARKVKTRTVSTEARQAASERVLERIADAKSAAAEDELLAILERMDADL